MHRTVLPKVLLLLSLLGSAQAIRAQFLDIIPVADGV
jgi:hypothetical protein